MNPHRDIVRFAGMVCIGVSCLVVVFMAPVATAAIFTGLGSLSDEHVSSHAWDISDDGTTVVGESAIAEHRTQAFRWTRTSGMVAIGTLPDSAYSSSALGVSGDGSMAVGYESEPLSANAVLWNGSGERTALTHFPQDSIAFGYAYDVSADGSTVVGNEGGPFFSEAFRWTQDNGLEPLGLLSGLGSYSAAFGVSSDGTTVVGNSDSEQTGGARFNKEAFRWTNADGMVGLGDLPGTVFSSTARDVSADGTTIVGTSDAFIDFVGPDEHEAFRWTVDGGMKGLGDLPGGDVFSEAHAVSADGKHVVGSSRSAGGDEAFLWTDGAGPMRSLRDLLIADDPTLADWWLTSATGVSADGRTIVGYGINPDGETEGWVAQLSAPVPAPSTGMLLGTGVLLGWFSLCWRWQRQQCPKIRVNA